uniref:Uncharacterized protein n=1 Tax=Rousettus aegyptiacus TaxID=9407 RepID=A0A7J8F1C0_ROUAE|nr:hypothetical protein HJG63_012270 [Rousettus aegyptiacus]
MLDLQSWSQGVMLHWKIPARERSPVPLPVPRDSGLWTPRHCPLGSGCARTTHWAWLLAPSRAAGSARGLSSGRMHTLLPFLLQQPGEGRSSSHIDRLCASLHQAEGILGVFCAERFFPLT